MSDLRTAAQQMLEAWDGGDTEWFKQAYTVMENLRAALAQQVEPVQEPRKFDHGIGADRFKVVRGPAYTWCVLIGDSPTKHGKFYTQASAEEMAALLRREFRNGAFVQHEASAALAQQAEPLINQCGETCERAKLCAVCASKLAEPVEPVAWMVYTLDGKSVCVTDNPDDFSGGHRALPLYTAQPQRKPLTEESLLYIYNQLPNWGMDMDSLPQGLEKFARAVERAHGIKE